jgi:hypothetical protein
VIRHARLLAAIIALKAIAPNSSAAANPEPFWGTWTLDRERSRYELEPPPERMTIVLEPQPDGLSYRSESRYPDGRTLALHYVARFDGIPAMVVGTAGLLAPVSLSRAGDAAIDAVYSMGLKKIAWSHWSVNAEGSELEITTTSVTQHGEEIRNVAIFQREAAGKAGG